MTSRYHKPDFVSRIAGRVLLPARLEWIFDSHHVIDLVVNAKRQVLLERIAALPDEVLGDVEESVDEIERWRAGVFRLTDEERAAVRKGMDAAQRGDFVSNEELAAFYRRHGG